MFEPVWAGTPAKLVWAGFLAHWPQNGCGGAAYATAPARTSKSAPKTVFSLMSDPPDEKQGRTLLHRHRFREVARLVDVGAAMIRDVVAEELGRDHRDDRHQQR